MPERKVPEQQTSPVDPAKDSLEAGVDDPTEGQSAQQKEGHGAVPNVTPKDERKDVQELKEAVHEVEEKKGDWGKSH